MRPPRWRRAPNEFVVANDQSNVIFALPAWRIKVDSLARSDALPRRRAETRKPTSKAPRRSAPASTGSRSRSKQQRSRHKRAGIDCSRTRDRDDDSQTLVPASASPTSTCCRTWPVRRSLRYHLAGGCQTRGRAAGGLQHRRARGNAGRTTADRFPQSASGRSRLGGSVGESGRSRRRQTRKTR